MRPLTQLGLSRYRNVFMERVMIGAGIVPSLDEFGIFEIPVLAGIMRVIASAGEGWDHVSVSMANDKKQHQRRCPTWDEMEYAKRRFFKDDETAMQLHVPPAEHISVHPVTLHLWRPWGTPIPRPPKAMV